MSGELSSFVGDDVGACVGDDVGDGVIGNPVGAFVMTTGACVAVDLHRHFRRLLHFAVLLPSTFIIKNQPLPHISMK